LTPEGAKLFDVSGHLKAGLSFCPPEGDAQPEWLRRTAWQYGPVMYLRALQCSPWWFSKKNCCVHIPKLICNDAGRISVAMVHANNCTSDYDAWISLFGEAVRSLGFDVPKSKLYDVLLASALQGDPGLRRPAGIRVFIRREHYKIRRRPAMFVRSPNSSFTTE